MDLRKAKARRSEMRAGFMKIAKSYAKKIHKALGNATIVLYGSVARGDFNRSSDIDIIVVSDSLPKNFLDRLDFLLEKAMGGIEPKGYTKKEFEQLIKKKNFKAMLAKRVILLDELGLLS